MASVVTINPWYIDTIDAYVKKAREEKWDSVEFAWCWAEELDKTLQKAICQYCMGKYYGMKVTNLGWGFSIKLK